MVFYLSDSSISLIHFISLSSTSKSIRLQSGNKTVVATFKKSRLSIQHMKKKVTYLKKKKFNQKMPQQEQIDRAFIRAMEVVGLHTAIMEWAYHRATPEELLDIYLLISQELDKKTLFGLGYMSGQCQR